MELKTYTVKELAAALGVSDATVYRRKSAWPHLRVGGDIRFTEAQVAEIVDMLTVRPIEPPSEPPRKRYGIMASRGPRPSR
ncbi:helix-turn-helix domain-containing protein [Arthrobacter dokdonensis]|uniref:helix-turn-helix domain-containing protein n=1 Tax=Arthrobacter dokdonellae TaxID=2211210 RepID=UPI000DE5A0BB